MDAEMALDGHIHLPRDIAPFNPSDVAGEDLEVATDLATHFRDALDRDSQRSDADAEDNEEIPLDPLGIRRSPCLAAQNPTPTLRETPAAPGQIEKTRSKDRSKLRRLLQKQSATSSHVPHSYRPRLSTMDRFSSLKFTQTPLISEALPAGIWVGKRLGKTLTRKHWTIGELVSIGFRLIPWEGRCPRLILDNSQRICAVLAGRPDDSTWDASMKAAAAAMVCCRVSGRKNKAFASDPEVHRRGAFTAIPTGVSFGSGQKVPGNLLLSPKKRAIADVLLENPHVKRIAGFQSACLGFYFPKVYQNYHENLSALYERHASLSPSFPGISIYPACTFNLGPQTATFEHTDSANVPYGLCAITALGNFDPKRGGHLILFDLKLVIEFPPGSTVLIPSSVLRHGNTPVVGDGAYRMSFTQYCAGGLFRWVKYGFQTGKKLLASGKAGAQRKAEIDGTLQERTQSALGLFSTVDTLEADRRRVFRPTS